LTERDFCPFCGTRSVEMRKAEMTIPHFGRMLIVTFLCEKCGYRHSDTVPLEDHEPSKNIIKVNSADDLRIKIARSGTGSIEIPELGLRLDPGDESQSFITNVEGILARFEGSVISFEKLHNNREAECRGLLRRISLARQGKLCFTIVVDDPAGNSGLVNEDAVSRDV
jgi:zinc finger protein